MIEAIIIQKEIAYGRQRYRSYNDGSWEVLMYGSHGPNNPPVGLSWAWRPIPKNKVPEDVRREGYDNH